MKPAARRALADSLDEAIAKLLNPPTPERGVVDYQLIREMEHECGIGLPHSDDCYRCNPGPPISTSGKVVFPSQDEWTEMVTRRYGPG